jgi:Helix-turn-helix of DDE superfamily endonuclease
VLLEKGCILLRYQDIAHSETSLLVLTSLTPTEFRAFVPAFETCFLEKMCTNSIDGLPRENRRYVSYKNSPLPTIEDKLLFIIVHMKQNLTQEVQGRLFGMRQSVANKWLQLLRPVLQCALQHVEALPSRNATILPDPDTASSDSPPFFTMMVLNVRSNDR